MNALAGLLTVLILSAVFGPRQAGRHIARIISGYREKGTPDMADRMTNHSELCDRLRGKYRIPIKDGLGPAGGEEPDNPNEFVQTFQTAPIQHEAAGVIEALAAELTAVKRDKERLDFLDRCNARINAQYGTNYGWELILNHNITRLMLGRFVVDLNDTAAGNAKLPSCRSAIDARMQSLAGAPAHV